MGKTGAVTAVRAKGELVVGEEATDDVGVVTEGDEGGGGLFSATKGAVTTVVVGAGGLGLALGD